MFAPSPTSFSSALSGRMPPPHLLSNNVPYPMGSDLPSIASFSHGGKVHGGKNVHVHLNSKECDILDHLQGGRKYCSKTGVRDFTHLENLLKNPHVRAQVHHHARQHGRQHHAMGGMASQGIHGDNEIGLIGPHTKQLFDAMSTDHSLNPNTGHPQYFSLGGALGGLWNTVKGAVGPALGGLFGGGGSGGASGASGGGSPLSGILGSLGGLFGGGSHGSQSPQQPQAQPGQQGQQPQGQPKFPQQSPTSGGFQGGLTQGLQNGFNSLMNGGSFRDALGQGMQGFGQGYGGGAFGQGIGQMGSMLGQGRGYGEAMSGGMRHGFNQMGGYDRLGDMARNTLGAYGRGGMSAAQNAFGGQMRNYGRQMMEPQREENDPYDMGEYGRSMFDEGEY